MLSKDSLMRDLLKTAKEAARLDPYGYVFYRRPSMLDDPTEQVPEEDDVTLAPGHRVFQNRYVDALLLEHSQLGSSPTRGYLERLLVNEASINPIACAAVIRLDRFPDASKRGSWVSVSCLTVIQDTLRYEPHLLSERLDSVKQLASNLIDHLSKASTQPPLHVPYLPRRTSPLEDKGRRLLRLVAEVPFDGHLRRLHESENHEINIDQKQVEAGIRLLGLDPKLQSLLAHVDHQFNTGGNDFGFASALGRLRAFYESLFAALVPIVDGFSRQRFRGNLANEKTCRSYLKSVGILTSSETELLESVYGFLSAEGAHALSAGRDQARVAKNILIELVWLLMQRIQKRQAAVGV